MPTQSYIDYLLEQGNKKGGEYNPNIKDIKISELQSFVNDYKQKLKTVNSTNHNESNKVYELLMKLSKQKDMDIEIRKLINQSIDLYNSTFSRNYFNNKTNEKTIFISNKGISDPEPRSNPRSNSSSKPESKPESKPRSNQRSNPRSNPRPKPRSKLRSKPEKTNEVIKGSIRELSNFVQDEYKNRGIYRFIEWKDVRGDGNCFYSAISLVFFGSQKFNMHIKEKIIKLINNLNSSNRKAFDILSFTGCKNKVEWINAIKGVNVYAGTNELQILQYGLKERGIHIPLMYFHRTFNNQFRCEGCFHKYTYNKVHRFDDEPVMILGHVHYNHWVGSFDYTGEPLSVTFKRLYGFFGINNS